MLTSSLSLRPEPEALAPRCDFVNPSAEPQPRSNSHDYTPVSQRADRSVAHRPL
jgi:hypothetical protein